MGPQAPQRIGVRDKSEPPKSIICSEHSNGLEEYHLALVAIVSTGLLFYVWVGYPLLIRLLALGKAPMKRRPVRCNSSVSVVIATREPDGEILDRLTDLARTHYTSGTLQFIVALDARRDSHEVPLTDLGIAVQTVVGDGPGGKAGALNAGVRAASGEILVFTDTGQRFAPDTIGVLVSALISDEKLGAVSGALHSVTTGAKRSIANLYWRYERRLRALEAQVHSAVGVTGAVYAMRRNSWSPLPSGLILDDLFTPMQLVLRGYRVGFDERAVATDARLFQPAAEYRRKARTLTGVLQLCAWMRPVLNPCRNPIWLQFVSHKLLRLLTPYLIAISAVAGGVTLARLTEFTVSPMFIGWLAVAATIPLVMSRRLRDLVWGGLLMQAAIVRATLNALRGDWDVWRS